MGTVINTNALALNSHKNLLSVGSKQATSSKKLSSGNRLISAAVDAAGMAISEKMKSQIEGLDMANKNTQDATSLLQTAEGAMDTINKMLSRVRELVVYASNDTQEHNINGTGDRQKIQDEIDQLIAEIDDTTKKTEFNKKVLLDGSWEDPKETLARATKNYENVSKAYTEALKSLDAATVAKNGDPTKVSDAKAILDKYNKAINGENRHDVSGTDIVKESQSSISGNKIGELTDLINNGTGSLEEALSKLDLGSPAPVSSYGGIGTFNQNDTDAVTNTKPLGTFDPKKFFPADGKINYENVFKFVANLETSGGTGKDKADINFAGNKPDAIISILNNTVSGGNGVNKRIDATDATTDDQLAILEQAIAAANASPVKDFLVAIKDTQELLLAKQNAGSHALSTALGTLNKDSGHTANADSLAGYLGADGNISITNVIAALGGIEDDLTANGNWTGANDSTGISTIKTDTLAALKKSGTDLADTDTREDILAGLEAALAKTVDGTAVNKILTEITKRYKSEAFAGGATNPASFDKAIEEAKGAVENAFNKMVSESVKIEYTSIATEFKDHNFLFTDTDATADSSGATVAGDLNFDSIKDFVKNLADGDGDDKVDKNFGGTGSEVKAIIDGLDNSNSKLDNLKIINDAIEKANGLVKDFLVAMHDYQINTDYHTGATNAVAAKDSDALLNAMKAILDEGAATTNEWGTITGFAGVTGPDPGQVKAKADPNIVDAGGKIDMSKFRDYLNSVANSGQSTGGNWDNDDGTNGDDTKDKILALFDTANGFDPTDKYSVLAAFDAALADPADGGLHASAKVRAVIAGVRNSYFEENFGETSDASTADATSAYAKMVESSEFKPNLPNNKGVTTFDNFDEVLAAGKIVNDAAHAAPGDKDNSHNNGDPVNYEGIKRIVEDLLTEENLAKDKQGVNFGKDLSEDDIKAIKTALDAIGQESATDDENIRALDNLISILEEGTAVRGFLQSVSDYHYELIRQDARTRHADLDAVDTAIDGLSLKDNTDPIADAEAITFDDFRDKDGNISIETIIEGLDKISTSDDVGSNANFWTSSTSDTQANIDAAKTAVMDALNAATGTHPTEVIAALDAAKTAATGSSKVETLLGHLKDAYILKEFESLSGTSLTDIELAYGEMAIESKEIVPAEPKVTVPESAEKLEDFADAKGSLLDKDDNVKFDGVKDLANELVGYLEDDKHGINFGKGIKEEDLADFTEAIGKLSDSNSTVENLRNLKEAITALETMETEKGISGGNVKGFLQSVYDHQVNALVAGAKEELNKNSLDKALKSLNTATSAAEPDKVTADDFKNEDGNFDMDKIMSALGGINPGAGREQIWSANDGGTGETSTLGEEAKQAVLDALRAAMEPPKDSDLMLMSDDGTTQTAGGGTKFDPSTALKEAAELLDDESEVKKLLIALSNEFIVQEFEGDTVDKNTAETLADIEGTYGGLVKSSEPEFGEVGLGNIGAKEGETSISLSQVKNLFKNLEATDFGDAETAKQVNDVLSKLNDKASFAENMGTLKTAIDLMGDTADAKKALTEIAKLYELDTYTKDHGTIGGLKSALEDVNAAYNESIAGRETAGNNLSKADSDLKAAEEKLNDSNRLLMEMGEAGSAKATFATASDPFSGFSTGMTKDEVDMALLNIVTIDGKDATDLENLTDKDVSDVKEVMNFLKAGNADARRALLEKYDTTKEGANETLKQLKSALAAKDAYDSAKANYDKAELADKKANNVFEAALGQKVNYDNNLKAAQDDYYSKQTINTTNGGQDTFADREDFIDQYGGYINDISKKGGTAGTVQAFDLAIKFIEDNGAKDIGKFTINDKTYSSLDEMKSGRTEALKADTAAEANLNGAQKTVDTTARTMRNLEAKIEKSTNDIKALNGKFAGLHFQVGANASQSLTFSLGSFTSETLGVGDGHGNSTINVLEDSGFDTTSIIDTIDDALSYINTERSKLGAAMNRLDYTSQNLQTSSVNLSDAKSRVADTDMAKEMMSLTQSNVLQQAAMSMLAQANQGPQQVLQLLQ